MRKISTLFKKDPNNLGLVVNEVNEENAWIYEFGIPTRKFDGTACAIIDGELYRRYDAKEGTRKKKINGKWLRVPFVKLAPEGAIPCQEKDPISGHQPFWVKCDRNDPSVKWYFVAFDKKDKWDDGTYECCGIHFQSNPEKLKGDYLIKHGSEILDVNDFTFYGLKSYLSNPLNDVEGIVFHDSSGQGRMCKIRKKDFGIKR